MRFMRCSAVVQLAALLGLGIGLHDIAFASSAMCQLPVSHNSATGSWRIDGACPDVDCDNFADCELVQLVLSLPQTFGCNCGAAGADCTMAYVGSVTVDEDGIPHGEGGTCHCHKNNCATYCPAPIVGGPSHEGWRSAFCPACPP